MVLGIMGSPRRNGTSERLLRVFMEKLEKESLKREIISISDFRIYPCQGCRFCEETGFCKIADDMEKIYYLLKEADLIVLSAPVFFYNFPSQLKAMIDRSQALWARRYRLGLKDPKEKSRRGFVISAGATKGSNLFTGIHLTAKYFFDALGAIFEGVHGLRNVEKPEDIDLFPEDVFRLEAKAKDLSDSLLAKKKICFVCRENSCRSQMAEALFQSEAEGLFSVMSAGDDPAKELNPIAVEVMAEIGLDIKFQRPKSLDDIKIYLPFDLVVTMGCETHCPSVYAKKIETWEIEDPKGKPKEKFREVRDVIYGKVKELLSTLRKD